MNTIGNDRLRRDQRYPIDDTRHQIRYKPIDDEIWLRFKAFEVVATSALYQQGQKAGVPLTTRIKFDWEIRRSGLSFPQTSPNIGPYGIIPFDTYVATMELVSQGCYLLNWCRFFTINSENSYSNFEYSPHRTRRIIPTEKAEELASVLDPQSDTPKLIRSIMTLATRIGMDPIHLGQRSKTMLLETVKNGWIPYCHIGCAVDQRQSTLDHVFSRPKDYPRNLGTRHLRDTKLEDIRKCREICFSIVTQKEDLERRPQIFLPELVRLWKHDNRGLSGLKVLYAGRFTETPARIGKDLLKAEFSISLYLKGNALQCPVFLHMNGFDSSKISPFGITENVFLLLGTVMGEADHLNRPIVMANALILVEDLQYHVPRFRSKDKENVVEFERRQNA